MVAAVGWKARLSWIARVLVVVLLLAVFWLARAIGLLMNALLIFIVVSAVIVIVWLAVAAFRRRLGFDAYREPRQHLPQLAASALKVVTWPCLAWAVDFALVPAQLGEHSLRETRLVLWLAAGALALTTFVPRRARWAASDGLFLGLLGLVSLELWRSHSDPPAAELVQIASPFQVPMVVFQGGKSSLINHHAALAHQASALDLVLTHPNGTIVDGDPSKLESYACFGAPIAAPISGRVAHVRRDLPDMSLGQTDRENITGNIIVIETDSHQYVALAHLQAGSIEVAEGDRVNTGQHIARCGNSGNTTSPHLHLQVQNRPVLTRDPDLRTYPIAFIAADRLRNGDRTPAPFSVRRNDVVEPKSPQATADQGPGSR
jgi:murein DD-endopeptidase MepM/ murein hydrolase activator NlpD